MVGLWKTNWLQWMQTPQITKLWLLTLWDVLNWSILLESTSKEIKTQARKLGFYGSSMPTECALIKFQLLSKKKNLRMKKMRKNKVLLSLQVRMLSQTNLELSGQINLCLVAQMTATFYYTDFQMAWKLGSLDRMHSGIFLTCLNTKQRLRDQTTSENGYRRRNKNGEAWLNQSSQILVGRE